MKRARASEYTRGGRAVRSALLIGNTIFCFIGCAVIAVGIYLLVEQLNFISQVLGTQLVSASCYLIIAAGSIMFLISFIGCFGTLFEYRTLLMVYLIVLSLVFLIAIIGSVLAIVFEQWVTDVLKIYMRESLLSTYGETMQNDWNNWVTRSWDEAQEKWHCCAIDDRGWELYRQTRWYRDLPGAKKVDKPYVPASCCVRDSHGVYYDKALCQYSLWGPPGRDYGHHNPALYYEGCFSAGRHILTRIVGYFIVMGFVMSLVVIAGIVLSITLYRII